MIDFDTTFDCAPIRDQTTEELIRIIQQALALWHKEGGKSAGPEGPVVSFGKRVNSGKVAVIVAHSIGGHEWATPEYYAEAAPLIGVEWTLYRSHCRIERETFASQLLASILRLDPVVAYPGMPAAPKSWQTISEQEQRRIIQAIAEA